MAARDNAVKLLGWGAITAAWIAVFCLLGATGLEFFLKFKWEAEEAKPYSNKPRFKQLVEAYRPFSVQHINPHYLFFFPFDRAKRAAVNNAVVTVNADGFRGPGPEKAGNREIAFLLGGSAAFGFYASSDETTITGYLNRIQERYFFVNTGVASWNSTQKLYRLANQIAEYKPALLIAYDGANDIAIMLTYAKNGVFYPPGTPESFDRLSALVENIRAESRQSTGSYIETLFPRLFMRARVAIDSYRMVGKSTHITEQMIEATVKKYTLNLSLMDSLSRAIGARFIGILQPMIRLHKNRPRELREEMEDGVYRRFHSMLLRGSPLKFEFHDFSSLFDTFDENELYFDRNGSADITDKTIFVDKVHLGDHGNELVARAILSRLCKTGHADQSGCDVPRQETYRRLSAQIETP